MELKIPESDWKHFQKVRLLALDRYCERVLAELRRLSDDSPSSHHDRYLAIYKMMHEADDILAILFNDVRRSTAFVQLTGICRRKLLTNEEMAGFRDDIRDKIENAIRD